ncbi:hypothetical protein Q5752_005368 [Cryptotrichosporon argae]
MNRTPTNLWHGRWHHFEPGAPAPPPPAGGLPPAAAVAAAAQPNPHHVVDYRWHYGRRRFGLFRRFFWAGLGAGAATLYFATRDRDRQARAIEVAHGAPHGRAPAGVHPADPPVYPPNGDTATSAGGRGGTQCWREKRWQWDASPAAQSQQQQHAAPTPAAPASPAPVSPQAAQSPTAESAHTLQPGPAKVGASDELRAAAEQAWADRAALAAGAKERANDQARAYARDRLDALAGAIDKLRESLKEDKDEKLV